MNAFLDAKPDTNYSTYRHIIRFAGRNPKIGYSKKINFNEKEDKRLLLAEIISRLALKNFDDGAWEFEVVKRNWVNEHLQATEEKLVSIYPDGYELHGKYKFDTVLTTFLDSLLTHKDTKRAMKASFDSYSPLSFVGNSLEQLKAECGVLKLYYPYDRVRRLYDACCKKYKWGEYEDKPQEKTEPTVTAVIRMPVETKRGSGATSIGALIEGVYNNLTT